MTSINPVLLQCGLDGHCLSSRAAGNHNDVWAPRRPNERRDIVLLQSIKACTAAGFFMCASALGSQTAASAQAPFDGVWSISIVTTKGTCEGGSGLSVKINEGKVASGDTQFGVSGRVADHGGITVTVVQGETRATGSGKLANTAGFGTWRGGPCSGTWTAQRI
jgi:hypothetical protein